MKTVPQQPIGFPIGYIYYSALIRNCVGSLKRLAPHIEHPAKGVVGMTDYLLKNNYKVGLRCVRRLMRLMGIDAVYRRKSFSTLGKAIYIKQYLLRRLKNDYRNLVWSIDITHKPMKKGLIRAKDNIWIERF